MKISLESHTANKQTKDITEKHPLPFSILKCVNCLYDTKNILILWN